MYAAMIVMSGEVHNGCKTMATTSNRLTSFDSRLTSFPGADSINDFCDSRNAYEQFIVSSLEIHRRH